MTGKYVSPFSAKDFHLLTFENEAGEDFDGFLSSCQWTFVRLLNKVSNHCLIELSRRMDPKYALSQKENRCRTNALEDTIKYKFALNRDTLFLREN